VEGLSVIVCLDIQTAKSAGYKSIKPSAQQIRLSTDQRRTFVAHAGHEALADAII